VPTPKESPIAAERLRFLALAALAELVEEVKSGPIEPSFAIRAILAVLYSYSDGDRAPFDEFWRNMQKSWSSQPSATQAQYCRQIYLRTSLRGIVRAVGAPETPEFAEQLEVAWRGAKI
jgi:hypothetical protein